jgi:dTDP-4-dehydrorhamnose reductase
MRNIVVFGASGQLGQCLQQLASERNSSYIHFLSRQQGDIMDTGMLHKVFHAYKACLLYQLRSLYSGR